MLQELTEKSEWVFHKDNRLQLNAWEVLFGTGLGCRQICMNLYICNIMIRFYTSICSSIGFVVQLLCWYYVEFYFVPHQVFFFLNYGGPFFSMESRNSLSYKSLSDL